MNPITRPPDGDQNRGPAMMAVFISQTVVSAIVMAMRFHSRRLIRNVGWDDWLMLITLLMFIVTGVIACYMAAIGGCRHLFFLDDETKYITLKLQWVVQPFAISAFGFAKASIGIFLLRVLPPGAFWRPWIVWITIVLSVIINALGAIFVFIQCNPPRKLWDVDVPGTCWDPKVQVSFEIFVGSWNAFTDIFFALLPITIVWNLRLEPAKKWGLAFILGMGGFASICAAIKCSALNSLLYRPDLTWETMPLFAWTGSEIFVLIICGSVPTLKPLYDLIFHGKSFSRYNRSYEQELRSEAYHSHQRSHLSQSRARSSHNRTPGLPQENIPSNEVVGSHPWYPSYDVPGYSSQPAELNGVPSMVSANLPRSTSMCHAITTDEVHTGNQIYMNKEFAIVQTKEI